MDANSSISGSRLEQLIKRFDTLGLVACARSLTQLASNREPVKLLKSIITHPQPPNRSPGESLWAGGVRQGMMMFVN